MHGVQMSLRGKHALAYTLFFLVFMILISILSLTNERRLESAWLFGTEDEDDDDSPVDCDGHYADYGECLGDCGDGLQKSTFVRTVEPKNGGASCPAPHHRSCKLEDCKEPDFDPDDATQIAEDEVYGEGERGEGMSCNRHIDCEINTRAGANREGIACRQYSISKPDLKACLQEKTAESLCNLDKVPRVNGGTHIMSYDRQEGQFGMCKCDETLSIVIDGICFTDAISNVKNVPKAIDKEFKLQVYRRGDGQPKNDGTNVAFVCSKGSSHSWALFPGGRSQATKFQTFTNATSQDAMTHRTVRGVTNAVAIKHVTKGGDYDWLRVAFNNEFWFDKASPVFNFGPMKDHFLFSFHRGKDSVGEEYILISAFVNGSRWFLADQDYQSFALDNHGDKFHWTQFPLTAPKLLYFRVLD